MGGPTLTHLFGLRRDKCAFGWVDVASACAFVYAEEGFDVSVQVRRARLSRWWIGGASLCAVVVGAVLAVTVEQGSSPPDSPEEPEAEPVQVVDPCVREIAELGREASRPGTPWLDANRALLLARARAEPVLFFEPPEAEKPGELRQRLFESRDPASLWRAVLAAGKTPEQLRALVLSDGYLYAETPELAVLFNDLSLTQLFSEPALVLLRGNQVRRLRREGAEYRIAEGPEEGQVALLWLFDRVVVEGQEVSRPRHVALGDLAERLGSTEIRVERLTDQRVLAKVLYEDLEVPTLFEVVDGALELRCELLDEKSRNLVHSARRTSHRRARVQAAFNLAIGAQVDAGIPFDEPKTEEGQEDGKLRGEWRLAYRSGARSFEYNGDRYPVFDALGRPRVPQVCVDFITDTWELMSGTHYGTANQPRARQIGRLDFNTLPIANRRSVEQLLAFASEHPEWFDVLTIPEAKRVPLKARGEFFQRLRLAHRDYNPLDVIAILGYRDDEKLHYHSFFITKEDPLTGMPIWVASNAGRPRIRTWEAEMRNAPRRSVIARIRPQLSWLEQIVGTE